MLDLNGSAKRLRKCYPKCVTVEISDCQCLLDVLNFIVREYTSTKENIENVECIQCTYTGLSERYIYAFANDSSLKKCMCVLCHTKICVCV